MADKELSTWTEDAAMAADREFVENPELERRFVAAISVFQYLVADVDGR